MAPVGAARQEDSLLELQMQLGSLQYPRNPMKGALEHFHFLLVLAGGPGSAPPALVFFVASIGLPGNVFVAAPWFSICGGRLSEHFHDRNALGFARRRTSKLVGRAATQLNANSKSSPSR